MPASDKRERRGHFRGKPRPGRRVEVDYRVGDGAMRRAYTRNIGIRGAFVVTPSPPPVGTPVQLRLLLTGPTGSPAPIEVRAEVRWTSATADLVGMGLKFHALEVEELLALNEYFASLAGTEAGPED